MKSLLRLCVSAWLIRLGLLRQLLMHGVTVIVLTLRLR